MVDAERLNIFGACKPDRLGYITCIFEDTYDSRFHIWEIHKYKEDKDFIKKLCVCGLDVILPEELITYESLVQEATREYHDLVYSNQWDLATGKDKYQDQPSLPKAYTVAIENLVNKSLKQVDFNSRLIGNGSGS